MAGVNAVNSVDIQNTSNVQQTLQAFQSQSTSNDSQFANIFGGNVTRLKDIYLAFLAIAFQNPLKR